MGYLDLRGQDDNYKGLVGRLNSVLVLYFYICGQWPGLHSPSHAIRKPNYSVIVFYYYSCD